MQLFDFGVADDGTLLLRDGAARRPRPRDARAAVRPAAGERAIHLLRQVCHSLAEAESRGLVHRDIKPANIFVCRYGGEHDFVKVLDFGIAKGAAHMMETGAIALTRDNVVHGTPAYIAPEQALGGARWMVAPTSTPLDAWPTSSDRATGVHGATRRWGWSCITRTRVPRHRRSDPSCRSRPRSIA